MTARSWFEQLLSEALIAFDDPFAVRAMAVACLAVVMLAAGGLVTVSVLGIVPAGASRVEYIGVALCTVLILVAVIWAAIASSGSSAFTPSAVAMIAALGWALVDRGRRRRVATPRRRLRDRVSTDGVRSAIALALIVVGVIAFGLTYGVTMNPSPRDGMQPIPFFDEAFYSVLGRDLARTGIENLYSPSGFTEIAGLPDQTWYHWGELWLAAGLDGIGVGPMHVRHYVVLPILLVAGAMQTGAIVRVATSSRGIWPLVFAAAAFLFMAPLPLHDTHFANWTRGMLFGMTMYGLAVIIALLLAYRYLAGGHDRRPAQILFEGAVVAALLAAHVVLAGLLALSIAAVGGWRIVQSGRIDIRTDTWRVFAVGAALSLATLGWGIANGHGIGTSGLSETVEPFNWVWRLTLFTIAVGGLPMWAIAFARPIGAARPVIDLLLVSVVALVVGALVWGARLGDFTSFHAFFGPLAVLVTPGAIVALVLLTEYVSRRRRLVAVGLKAFLAVYLTVGGVTTLLKLHEFGFAPDSAIPTAFLQEVSRLPDRSPIGYQCGEESELAFWNPRLVAIDAYTGHPMVPLCFQSEMFPVLTGTAVDGTTMSPLFRSAPQREIFPAAGVQPSEQVVYDWMQRHGVTYIFADENHPNTIAPSAIVIIDIDGFTLSRIP